MVIANKSDCVQKLGNFSYICFEFNLSSVASATRSNQESKLKSCVESKEEFIHLQEQQEAIRNKYSHK